MSSEKGSEECSAFLWLFLVLFFLSSTGAIKPVHTELQRYHSCHNYVTVTSLFSGKGENFHIWGFKTDSSTVKNKG